jgi:hypothetical protein
LVELAQSGGKDCQFVPDGDTPNDSIGFKILPNNYRDGIKNIEVIDSSKLIGFNTYNDIMNNEKSSLDDSESDFYNVTVNLIVRR